MCLCVSAWDVRPCLYMLTFEHIFVSVCVCTSNQVTVRWVPLSGTHRRCRPFAMTWAAISGLCLQGRCTVCRFDSFGWAQCISRCTQCELCWRTVSLLLSYGDFNLKQNSERVEECGYHIQDPLISPSIVSLQNADVFILFFIYLYVLEMLLLHTLKITSWIVGN